MRFRWSTNGGCTRVYMCSESALQARQSIVPPSARSDAEQLKRRPPADDKRHAVMLRSELTRYAAWEREAMQLLDEASGWQE